MFTGIIEEIGTIKGIRRGNDSVVLDIEARHLLEDVKIGDSIATNGVCLTVTSLKGHLFSADAMPETMHRTTLGGLRPGDRVNLERALCLNGRLGGHIVAGHVDGVGEIVRKDKNENAVWITVSAPPAILKYIIEKGSVAIDGVSLTVAYIDESAFKVSVIPHTQGQTTLIGKFPGDKVNLENDMIAKYVEKLMSGGKSGGGISLEFLQENGF